MWKFYHKLNDLLIFLLPDLFIYLHISVYLHRSKFIHRRYNGNLWNDQGKKFITWVALSYKSRLIINHLSCFLVLLTVCFCHLNEFQLKPLKIKVLGVLELQSGSARCRTHSTYAMWFSWDNFCGTQKRK